MPKPSISRKIAKVCMLFACMLATGGLWDALQLVAWAGMTLDNLREAPVEQALSRTFSNEGKCSMCNFLEEAREQPADGAMVRLVEYGERLLVPAWRPVRALPPVRPPCSWLALQPEAPAGPPLSPEPPPPRAA
jgi:hypothetical protein